MEFEPTSVGSTAVCAAENRSEINGLDVARLWHAVLGRLQLDVSAANYETWLKPTKPLGMTGGRLIVEARSSFAVSHLNTGLGVVIERAIEEIAGTPVAVEFVPSTPQSEATTRAQGKFTMPVVGALHPAYRFESFHLGEGNHVAATACRALIGTGVAASPVVVWGLPGVGKTHLAHATAAEGCLAGWPVACLSAEEFTTRYMSAVRRDSIEEFHSIFRKVRLLLVDDIQYFVGKRGTVDELIHTMDAVLHSGGAIVATSEEHPAELELPDRLTSRLMAGSSVQLACLQSTERVRFIESIANELRTPLPDWAIDRVVRIEVRTMRALRGAVCAAVGLHRAGVLDRRRLDAELIRVGTGTEALSDSEVVEVVGQYFGVSAAEIAGRSRAGSVRDARAVTVAALKGRGRSLSQLATTLGGRDPSTISGLAERGRGLLDQSPDLLERVAG